MRSIHIIDSVKCLSRHDEPGRRSPSFPRIEYQFHAGWGRGPNGYSFGDGAPARRSALNRLTQEALGSDANRSFRIETAVLALITIVSAWPIAIMISAVIRLLGQGA